jgi:predicted ABC-type ATPase
MANGQSDTNSRVFALRAAQWIGCTGAHKKDGKWMPCETPEELEKISKAAEPKNKTAFEELHARYNTRKAKGRKKKRGWEKLKERKPLGFATLEGGGIVSAPIVAFPDVTLGSKSYIPGVTPRDNDPDVFTDIESARKRSRMLGCIGVRRMPSATGRTVWMPCTSNSDYARLAGTTFLGRRGQQESQRRMIRTIVRGELNEQNRRQRIRKKSLFEELNENKGLLGRAIGRASGPGSLSRRMRRSMRSAERIEGVLDPRVRRDVDGDGFIFDGTSREMPDPTRAAEQINTSLRSSGKRGFEPAWFASRTDNRWLTPDKIKKGGKLKAKEILNYDKIRLRANRDEQAQALGVSRATMDALHEPGASLDPVDADRLSISALDLHPALIWGEAWLEQDEEKEKTPVKRTAKGEVDRRTNRQPNPLDERDKKILELRRNGATIQGIADELGISKQRTSELLKRAIKRNEIEEFGDSDKPNTLRSEGGDVYPRGTKYTPQWEARVNGKLSPRKDGPESNPTHFPNGFVRYRKRKKPGSVGRPPLFYELDDPRGPYQFFRIEDDRENNASIRWVGDNGSFQFDYVSSEDGGLEEAQRRVLEMRDSFKEQSKNTLRSSGMIRRDERGRPIRQVDRRRETLEASIKKLKDIGLSDEEINLLMTGDRNTQVDVQTHDVDVANAKRGLRSQRMSMSVGPSSLRSMSLGQMAKTPPKEWPTSSKTHFVNWANGRPSFNIPYSLAQKHKRDGDLSDRDWKTLLRFYTQFGPENTSGRRLRSSGPTTTQDYANIGAKRMAKIILDRVSPDKRNRPVGKRRHYHIIGPGGVGKSTLTEYLKKEGLIPDENGAAHVDPDFIKMGIEGYEGGKGSEMVHRESAHSATRTVNDAKEMGMDIVTEGTGYRLHDYKTTSDNAYEKVFHVPYLPYDKAEARVRARNAEGKRQLPVSQIRNKGYGLYGWITDSLRRGQGQTMYIWDMDVPKGAAPRVIAKIEDGVFTAIDEPKFKAWSEQHGGHRGGDSNLDWFKRNFPKK